ASRVQANRPAPEHCPRGNHDRGAVLLRRHPGRRRGGLWMEGGPRLFGRRRRRVADLLVRRAALMGAYFDALCAAMRMVADEPRVIFMGQAVAYPGTAMTNTFKGIATDKLLEMPVAEDMQLGMATGMSLAGWLPV